MILEPVLPEAEIPIYIPDLGEEMEAWWSLYATAAVSDMIPGGHRDYGDTPGA